MSDLSFSDALITAGTFLLLPIFLVIFLAIFIGKDVAFLCAHFVMIGAIIVSVMRVVLLFISITDLKFSFICSMCIVFNSAAWLITMTRLHKLMTSAASGRRRNQVLLWRIDATLVRLLPLFHVVILTISFFPALQNLTRNLSLFSIGLVSLHQAVTHFLS